MWVGGKEGRCGWGGEEGAGEDVEGRKVRVEGEEHVRRRCEWRGRKVWVGRRGLRCCIRC